LGESKCDAQDYTLIEKKVHRNLFPIKREQILAKRNKIIKKKQHGYIKKKFKNNVNHENQIIKFA